uniref:Uncharacterized protein n=1 Tax=Lotharella globosa TaxID=91324 RepID=A0A7S3Z164_9EUKA
MVVVILVFVLLHLLYVYISLSLSLPSVLWRHRDNIAHSYEIIRQDGSSRIVTWRLLPSDTRENILSNVTFWCTKVHWCKGYSYDETNKHYYLFKHLPSPHLPPTDNNDNNNNNNKNSSSN